jgi:effector-binding domain-containing protein
MRALKWLFIFFAVVIGGAVIVGFLLPDQVHVERSIVTSAKPGTVHAALNGFRRFNQWSPWAELDPNAVYTTEGPVVGVGARSAWASNDPNVGSGSQEIVETRANEHIRIRVVFSGFDSENYSTFTLVPEGEGTRITWAYDTTFHGNLMGRYFGLMLDDMIGADHEKGLARLKTLVEGLPAVTGAVPLEVVTVAEKSTLVVSGEVPASQATDALKVAYAKIDAVMAAQGIGRAEPPLAITRHFDDRTKLWRYDAAVVPDRDPIALPPGSEVRLGARPAGTAIRALHSGPHETLDDTYGQIIALKIAAGLEDAGLSWEQYLSDPAVTAPTELQTAVYWLVR